MFFAQIELIVKLVKRLRELREERTLSQTAVANAIGFSTKAISQYETGAREPSIETIKALCTFFGVSSDYLLGLKDE